MRWLPRLARSLRTLLTHKTFKRTLWAKVVSFTPTAIQTIQSFPIKKSSYCIVWCPLWDQKCFQTDIINCSLRQKEALSTLCVSLDQTEEPLKEKSLKDWNQDKEESTSNQCTKKCIREMTNMIDTKTLIHCFSQTYSLQKL